MGHTVVMGRLTWESLPAKVRPLPGRRNVVVTRQADYMADGADVVAVLDDALTDDITWVIGGAQIYALALPLATRCEVTEVEIDLPRDDGDAVAPVLDEIVDRHRGGVADQLLRAALPVLQLRPPVTRRALPEHAADAGPPDRGRRAGIRRAAAGRPGHPRAPAAADLADPGAAAGFGVGGGARPLRAGVQPARAVRPRPSSTVPRGATARARRGCWSSTGRTRPR